MSHDVQNKSRTWFWNLNQHLGIAQQATASYLSSQLHAIWYCLPTDTNKPLLETDKQFFKKKHGTGKSYLFWWDQRRHGMYDMGMTFSASHEHEYITEEVVEILGFGKRSIMNQRCQPPVHPRLTQAVSQYNPVLFHGEHAMLGLGSKSLLEFTVDDLKNGNPVQENEKDENIQMQSSLECRLGQSHPCKKQSTWHHVLSKQPSIQVRQCLSSLTITIPSKKDAPLSALSSLLTIPQSPHASDDALPLQPGGGNQST
ncbi:hypothetical protein GGX14DRAFT_395888 [Mycena pura]|uniref:Uncharacterized protein n=1 Tax=Mycena pura TaxID=153505 RepID=A0AAD6VFG4_9AGAR|nr:hypothetical protein GGX14DRAFT_395888 [Mycena pura]